MEKAQRDTIIADIAASETDIGPLFKERVLRWATQSAGDDLAAYIACVTPFPAHPGASFDITKPCLGSAQLGDVNTAALMLKLIVHEQFTPRLRKGEPAALGVYLLAERVKEMVAKKPPEVGPALSTALEELEEVCTYLLALRDGSLDSEGVAKISSSMLSARDGSKGLIRTAMKLSKHWAKVMSDANRLQLALSTYVPRKCASQ